MCQATHTYTVVSTRESTRFFADYNQSVSRDFLFLELGLFSLSEDSLWLSGVPIVDTAVDQSVPGWHVFLGGAIVKREAGTLWATRSDDGSAFLAYATGGGIGVCVLLVCIVVPPLCPEVKNKLSL